MNFQQLEYVIAVHRHQHFAKAADSCHVTQATLSGMIKRLESELEVVLFDRSKQPVITTEKGVEFIELALDILAKKKHLEELKDISSNELKGKLNIGIIPTVASSLLPIILPEVAKDNPGLELIINEITTSEVIDQLKSDKIDLGILSTPLDEPLLDTHILYYESMMVYGVRDNKKKFLSTADVKNSNIWLLEEGHCFRNQTMTVCDMKEKDIGSTNLKFVGNSFETLLNLTDSFGGFTLVPELYVKSMSKPRQKITKPFQSPLPVREISLVSIRLHAKKMAIGYFTHLIKSKVDKRLITTKMKNKDLEIIGINN